MQGRKTALKSHYYILFNLSPITSKKKKKSCSHCPKTPKPKFNQFHFQVTAKTLSVCGAAFGARADVLWWRFLGQFLKLCHLGSYWEVTSDDTPCLMPRGQGGMFYLLAGRWWKCSVLRKYQSTRRRNLLPRGLDDTGKWCKKAESWTPTWSYPQVNCTEPRVHDLR